MDKTIRKNEICIIGLPRCDFVFSSTRTCFIAYGFSDSPLEKDILKDLLEQRGIQPVEAGGALAPAQNAFCAKICSKIITSQFCVVLINNEESEGREIPNFRRLAADAIEQAIRETQQDPLITVPTDQGVQMFLLAKKAIVTPINNDGDRNIYQLGSPLGFNLLNDFTGMRYMFLGHFTTLRPEVVVWRINMLTQIFEERRASIGQRVKVGIIPEPQAELLDNLFARLQIWILVTSDADKIAVQATVRGAENAVEVFSLDDVRIELESLERMGR